MDEVKESWTGIDPATADYACVNASDQQSDLCNPSVNPTGDNVDGIVLADARGFTDATKFTLLPGSGLRVEIAALTPHLSE
jgi:hypothetical protein